MGNEGSWTQRGEEGEKKSGGRSIVGQEGWMNGYNQPWEGDGGRKEEWTAMRMRR